MGTISKHVAKNGDVTYQEKVRRKAFPSQTKTFVEKKDCEKWIRAAEAALDRGEILTQPKPAKPHASGLNTLADVLRWYRDKVCPDHRGDEIEVLGINRWLRECRAFVATPVARLDASKIAARRDDQL